MMNENIDDDDDEEEEDIILDRRNLIHKVNNPSSTSGPIFFGLHQYNIRTSDDSNKLSREKTIILSATCISIGMFIGLLGPTFPFLAQNMSIELSSIIWLITVKAIGFLIGTCSSFYLYTWFNVCCLLGLSCLSISFGICSLPFITDLTTFYLSSLIIGISLGLSYNGIDALYNRLWARSSVSSIRWLHLLVAIGAILSTLLLLPSTISTGDSISLSTNITHLERPRREISTNITLLSNLSVSTTPKVITKPLVVISDNLTHALYTKPPSIIESSTLVVRVINTNSSTAIMTSVTSTTRTTTLPLTSSTTLTTSTTTANTPSTTTKRSTTHRNKPPTAESNNDDLSRNLLYLKIRFFFQSITSIHLLYLFISLSFFLLGIFYSILAMRGEGMNSASVTNLNPLSLLFLQPHRIITNSNTQISLLSDRKSLHFVCFIILFYLILSAIENSCTYLTYSFGRHFELSETKSLLLHFCYLSGRLSDILINYAWFLLNKHIKTRSELISIKLLIFLRLIILFVICFSNLFHQLFYVVFFSIGFLTTSLSSLVLYWIERDLSLSEMLLRIIFVTIIISEILFPIFLFSKIEYLIQFYLLIGLCLLIILFLIILYSSKKWQKNRLYRLLPTSIEMESQDNTDNDDDNQRLTDSKLH